MASMKAHDRAALQLAINLTRRESAERRRQIDDMLRHDDWFAAATFAAYHCRVRALRLKPWETPPLYVVDPDDPNAGPCRGTVSNNWPAAARLVKQMQALGISKFHPDPIAAIEAAARARMESDNVPA